jgi:hypothetical protein
VRRGATSQDGVPVGMTFFMGSICLLAAAGDVRMLLRGGVLARGASRGASMADVFWTVHRLRIVFYGTQQSPVAVA